MSRVNEIIGFGLTDRKLLDDAIAWITSIPFARWPQQMRSPLAPSEIRPAMVNNLSWEDFGKRTDALTEHALDIVPNKGPADARNRMLSVVMPGARIEPHDDRNVLTSTFRYRAHVPLTSNDHAWWIHHRRADVLEVGAVYVVRVDHEHAVWNAGDSPRVHLTFDVHAI